MLRRNGTIRSSGLVTEDVLDQVLFAAMGETHSLKDGYYFHDTNHVDGRLPFREEIALAYEEYTGGKTANPILIETAIDTSKEVGLIRKDKHGYWHLTRTGYGVLFRNVRPPSRWKFYFAKLTHG